MIHTFWPKTADAAAAVGFFVNGNTRQTITKSENSDPPHTSTAIITLASWLPIELIINFGPPKSCNYESKKCTPNFLDLEYLSSARWLLTGPAW